MIEMEKHSFQKLLWTGIALKKFAYPTEVSDSIMRDGAGFIVPAGSPTPLSTSTNCLCFCPR